MNTIYLCGNVGKDPKSGENTRGQWLIFTMATEESWKDKDGEWQKKTDWHTVTAYGKLATRMASRLSKGDRVLVIGKLVYRKKDDGSYSSQIEASTIELTVPQEKESPKPAADSAPQKTPAPQFNPDDDIPF